MKTIRKTHLFRTAAILTGKFMTMCSFSGCKNSARKEDISQQVAAFNASIKKSAANNAANGNIVNRLGQYGSNGLSALTQRISEVIRAIIWWNTSRPIISKA